MRDLAFLSMARTYYSASVRLDENNVPTIDSREALGRRQVLEHASTSAQRVLARQRSSRSRGRTSVAGDYAHALGNIHTIESPYFPNSFYPEADILKARHLLLRSASTATRTTIVAKLQAKYEPINEDLDKVLNALPGRGSRGALLPVPEGRWRRQGGPPAEHPTVVENAPLRSPAPPPPAVRAASSTTSRSASKKAPASFRDSPLGNDVKDALQLARDLAVRNAGQLARERYQRNLDELNEHLRDSSKILIDITAAEARTSSISSVVGRSGVDGKSRERTASSSPTTSTSSGRSTASTGATSSGSTGRPSPRSAGGRFVMSWLEEGRACAPARGLSGAGGRRDS